MRILLIDNYDSFTYNVVHALRQLGQRDVEVRRNTALNVHDLKSFGAVIASPGPGLPADSGDLLPAVAACLRGGVPYLGICLGHQALGEAVGAKLARLPTVRHGVQHRCTVSKADEIFGALDVKPGDAFDVGRYHSWVVAEEDLPEQFVPLARSEDGVVQLARVADRCAYGLQFHPESIMTAGAGPKLLGQFLHLAKRHHA